MILAPSSPAPDEVTAVLARAEIGEHAGSHGAEATGIVEFTIGQQSSIGGDAGPVKFQLCAAVFTISFGTDCPTNDELVYSYS